MRIVILTPLPLLPDWSQRRIFEIADRSPIPIEFIVKSPEWFRESKAPLSGADALICRPIDGLIFRPTDVQLANRPFTAMTFSTGTDHLDGISNLDGVRVISSSSGNAEGVAKWTIDMASELRRNTHRATEIAAQGEWRQDHRIRKDAHNAFPALLKGTTWIALGAGKQLQALLPHLCANNVGRLVVWNHKISEDRLGECLSGVDARLHEPIVEIEQPDFVRQSVRDSSGHPGIWYRTQVSFLSAKTTELFGTNASPIDFAHTADLLSIHLPLLPSTCNLVSKSVIDTLSPMACVLIASRGGIADEEALVARYDSGNLLGIAADTVEPEAERQKDSALSPLWKYYRQQSQKAEPLNISVTPHIAGTSVELTNAIVDEVLHEFEAAITTFSSVT